MDFSRCVEKCTACNLESFATSHRITAHSQMITIEGNQKNMIWREKKHSWNDWQNYCNHFTGVYGALLISTTLRLKSKFNFQHTYLQKYISDMPELYHFILPTHNSTQHRHTNENHIKSYQNRKENKILWSVSLLLISGLHNGFHCRRSEPNASARETDRSAV